MVAGSPQTNGAARLRGQTAIASAKVAYQLYQEIFRSERFKKLAARGARPQRLLWASTSTKNPAYSDTMYEEALIGPETINTMPLETLSAYRDHGLPERRLDQKGSEARQILDHLSLAGIDLDAITQQLEDEGVEKFSVAFDKMMVSLNDKSSLVLAATFTP